MPLRYRLLLAGLGVVVTTTSIGSPALSATKTKTKAKATKAVKPATVKATKPTTTVKPIVTTTAVPTTAPPTTAPPTTAAPATAAASKNTGAGRSILYIAGNESQGFNPAVSSKGNSLNGMRLPLVLDNMFLIDDKHDLVPRLGLSMTSGGDGRTWTIKVRPNVKFSDNVPLDAAAVKANIEFHQNAANRSIEASFANQVDRIDTPDALTVVLNLKAPNFVFDVVYAVRLGWVVSPKALADKTSAQLVAEPVGAGPYLLDQWIRDDRQIFKPNPGYWDKSATVFDKVEIRTIPDARQRIDTFASNKEADLVYIADENSAGELQAKGFKEVDGFDPGGGIDFRMQTSKPPFDDVRLRQAMELAVNRDSLNQVVYKGKALLLEKGIVGETNPLWDSATFQPPPNPAKAQQLIDSYVNEKNGGKTLNFTITVPTALRLEAEYIQQVLNTQMKNLNVRVDLLDAPTVSARNIARDFQALLFASAFVEPEVELTGFLRTGSPQNTTSFSDPSMDAVLTQLASSKNPASRKAAFTSIQLTLFDQVPFFYLRRTVFRVFYKDTIRSLKVWHDGKPIWTELQKS